MDFKSNSDRCYFIKFGVVETFDVVTLGPPNSKDGTSV